MGRRRVKVANVSSSDVLIRNRKEYPVDYVQYGPGKKLPHEENDAANDGTNE